MPSRRGGRQGRTSSHVGVTNADGRMAALTVKSAGWARASNIVWALEHATPSRARLEEIFRAAARLALPDARSETSASPAHVGAQYDVPRVVGPRLEPPLLTANVVP